MKKLLCLILLSFIVGCTTNGKYREMNIKSTLKSVCLNGVSYYSAWNGQGGYSLALAMSKEGKIQHCDDEE